jgi:hypothetical protein
MTCSNCNDLLDPLVGDGEQGVMVAECHQTAVGSSPDSGTWAQQTKDFVSGTRHKVSVFKVRERREPAYGHHAGLAIGFSSRVGSGTLEKLEVEL